MLGVLGISFGELMLIMMVALVALGPEHFLSSVKTLKSLADGFKSWYNDFINYLESEINGDGFVDIIIDEEGNRQKVYDVEKIKPFLKPSADERNDEHK